VQTADGEDMHRARAHEGFIGFVGQSGFPAQRHGPNQAQGLIFHRQAASQGGSGPGTKPVAQRSRVPAVQDLPVIGCGRGEEVMDAVPPQVSAVVE